jgi:hypothetical protein
MTLMRIDRFWCINKHEQSLVEHCLANFFLPTALPTLKMAPECTPQNFALQKAVTKTLGQKNRFPCGWVIVLYFTTLFSVTRLYNADDRMISEWWWIGKDLVEISSGLILRYYPDIRWSDWGKSRKINQVTRSPGLGFEPRTSRI